MPVSLLKAVAQVESSNRARVVARNTNGSLDIGYMQINDWWLPKLQQYGITKHTLLDDACINLNVGAWILKQGIDRYGYNAQGIGAYGAGTDPKKSQVRITYANKAVSYTHPDVYKRQVIALLSPKLHQNAQRPPFLWRRSSTVKTSLKV